MQLADGRNISQAISRWPAYASPSIRSVPDISEYPPALCLSVSHSMRCLCSRRSSLPCYSAKRSHLLVRDKQWSALQLRESMPNATIRLSPAGLPHRRRTGGPRQQEGSGSAGQRPASALAAGGTAPPRRAAGAVHSAGRAACAPRAASRLAERSATKQQFGAGAASASPQRGASGGAQHVPGRIEQVLMSRPSAPLHDPSSSDPVTAIISCHDILSLASASVNMT